MRRIPYKKIVGKNPSHVQQMKAELNARGIETNDSMKITQLKNLLKRDEKNTSSFAPKTNFWAVLDN